MISLHTDKEISMICDGLQDVYIVQSSYFIY